MSTGWIWLGVALTATAAGQLIYKKASITRSWPLTILAIAFFCIAPPTSYMALHQLSLATVYVSTAASQILVVLSSMFLFHERYSGRQWASLALILAGILLFNSSAFL